MATRRGFVEAIEIGRAGQASAFLLHEDGSRAHYRLDDLDADPERFNERLSKLGLLRDAMHRAEPVEIEFQPKANDASGSAIERVRRLTRDALDKPRQTARTSGLVVGLRTEIVNSPQAVAEPSDRTTLALLIDGTVERFVIQMQTPERGVAEAMAAAARQAQAGGERLTVEYETASRSVTAVEAGSGESVGGGRGEDRFDAFVESIAHTPFSDMMIVAVTTAPAFGGDGNIVPLEPFEPQEWTLLVMRGAPEYALLEAALRDKLRTMVLASETNFDPLAQRLASAGTTTDPDRDEADAAVGSLGAPRGRGRLGLVRGVELLAPLCSASRPVWIQVDRRALDDGPQNERRGPEAEPYADCADGLPTSDLKPRTMREIDLPYRAEWVGIGCFNHGVYRFEFELHCRFAIFIDGRELCVHKQVGEGRVRFAHACLDGDHEVRVVLEGWRCRNRFDMDVYRIR